MGSLRNEFITLWLHIPYSASKVPGKVSKLYQVLYFYLVFKINRYNNWSAQNYINISIKECWKGIENVIADTQEQIDKLQFLQNTVQIIYQSLNKVR